MRIADSIAWTGLGSRLGMTTSGSVSRMSSRPTAPGLTASAIRHTPTAAAAMKPISRPDTTNGEWPTAAYSRR